MGRKLKLRGNRGQKIGNDSNFRRVSRMNDIYSIELRRREELGEAINENQLNGIKVNCKRRYCKYIGIIEQNHAK